MFTFELILLIFLHIKNTNDIVKTYDKTYYKNFNICNYIKQKDIYTLSKLNKLFYFVYKNEIDKCSLCNCPCITITIKYCNNKCCKQSEKESNKKK
jgi:hypothetical protein